MPRVKAEPAPDTPGPDTEGASPPGSPTGKAEDSKKKPDDKGYNSSLAKMPDKKYDPWQNVR